MKTLLLMLMASLTFAIAPANEVNIEDEAIISFTLLNNSLKSIPLKIPGVMNPNLSPLSSSGVSLKAGQEIFFTYRGKKRLLIAVEPSLEGREIIVDELIKERKHALRKE